MPAFRIPLVAGLALLSAAGAAHAQSALGGDTLVKTEGVVYLDDRPVAAGTAFVTLGDATRIRTDVGRAVVSLKRGGALLLADHASVAVRANGPYNFNRVEMLAGSAVVVSAEGSPVVACGTDVTLSSAGVFRFDVDTPEPVDGSARCGFRVYEGAGTTPGASLTYILRAGQRMMLNRRCGDMIPVMSFSPNDLDEFGRWSQQAAASFR